MTTLIIILLIIALAVAVILALALRKPDVFRVTRAATIQAPPERIYPLIEDLRAWGAWSPYEKLDPAMQRTYSGEARGRGAAYAWQGNGKAGAGRMEIVDAAPPRRLSLKLDFTRPMAASNTVDFTLEPRGSATEVTWAMHGPQPLIGKVMCVFIDMDKMVGKAFEEGLRNLKAKAEAAG